jgi:hypothetical protein
LPLLVDLAGEGLSPGDILRLSDNYDTGPGSGPVDLMVYNPRDEERGLGVIVTSGYKAGLILSVFPKTSNYAKGGLSVDWLIANWDDWFVFTYATDHRIKVEEARVLFKEARTMPEELQS